jgi:hypothetical protein
LESDRPTRFVHTWMFIISGLKTLLETGRPLAERSTGGD